jgi:hypothetical protein
VGIPGNFCFFEKMTKLSNFVSTHRPPQTGKTFFNNFKTFYLAKRLQNVSILVPQNVYSSLQNIEEHEKLLLKVEYLQNYYI